MDFRTDISITPAPHSIGIADPIVTLGSCFAQTMGQRFADNKFQVEINPFGTTYHPLALHKLMLFAGYQEYPADHTYVENDGAFHNFHFHSSFSHADRSIVQDRVAEKIAALHFFLRKSRLLIVTYGTSWVYERNDTGEAVANCHKMPGSFFTRRLASVDEIVSSFQEVHSMIRTINSELRFILTVSPVRHLRDTLELNSVSKAILRAACHQLTTSHNNVEYFPAYEIMLDDLRDYRFYKADMIHPTETAEEYIWQKFSETYFDEPTRNFILAWQDIRKSMAHRPRHESSEAHRKFLLKTLSKLEELKSKIDVDDEIRGLKLQLNASVQ